MPPQPVILESQNATSVADGATIERRIRISQPDEGKGRCKGSRAWDPPKDFSQPTQPPITPSTSNASDISKNALSPLGPQPCGRGAKSSPPHDFSCETRRTHIKFSVTVIGLEHEPMPRIRRDRQQSI